MADGDKRFTAQDLLVIVAGAGLGAPLCSAAAKNALDGNTLPAIIGFVIGLPLIIFAAAFPFIKGNFASAVRSWIARLSAVSIIFVIFSLFVYLLGPGIYSHIVQSKQNRTYITTGPIDSDFEGKPLGFWWGGLYLNTNRDSNLTVSIFYFMIQGKNFGPQESVIDNAYLLSAIDSTRLELKIIAVPDGLIDIKEASPIPESAQFQLQADFRKANQVPT
jgi:hypothetical protein